MTKRLAAIAALSILSLPIHASELSDAIQQDYDDYLWPLFDHFHRNPELSLFEIETAARMAEELRSAGYDVTERVGGTGVVAMLENGPGPLVMMRADMDGLPVEEKSGLENASRAQQRDPITGRTERSCWWCNLRRSGSLGHGRCARTASGSASARPILRSHFTSTRMT